MQILLDYKFLLLSTNISISIILLGLVLAFLDNKISVIDSFIGLCLGYKLLGPIVLGGSVVSLLIYLISAKKNKLLPFGTGIGFATLFLIFLI